MRLGMLFGAAFLLSGAVSGYAYDYPVVGDYNSNYQKVFDDIKKGSCDSMDADLTALADAEGISGNIYKAFCYFENKREDDGFAVLQKMLDTQEYDETIYVCNALEKKGDTDPRVMKFKGLAYFNIGDGSDAFQQIGAYLEKAPEDDAARYAYADVLIMMDRYDEAEKQISMARTKDGRYEYRMGRISLKKGYITSAYDHLRKVPASEPVPYMKAQSLIADLCTATGRFVCADKSIKKLAASDDYKDTAADKLQKLSDKKKPLSLFLMVTEELDNNVTSIDEDEVTGASEKESFRTSIMADIKYNIFPSFGDKMTVGLFNYKNWNHSLQSYDVSNHKVYFQMKQGYDKFDIVLPKVSAGVTYFDGKKYSETYSLESSATYKADTYTIAVPVRIDKRFDFSDTNTGSTDKDGYVYSAYLQGQKMFLKKYTAGLSFGLSKDDAKGAERDKTEYHYQINGSYKATEKLSFSASAEYVYSDYTNSSIGREDDELITDVSVTYKLNSSFFLSAGLRWHDQDSNENSFDYNKTVMSTSVGYMY